MPHANKARIQLQKQILLPFFVVLRQIVATFCVLLLLSCFFSLPILSSFIAEYRCVTLFKFALYALCEVNKVHNSRRQ